MEHTNRRIYAQGSYPRQTAANTTSVFVLSDDDLIVTGLTAKSLRDLFEAALQAPMRSADQQDALELAGIVLDRLERSDIRHREAARSDPFATGARYILDRTPPCPSATPRQAAAPARLNLAS